MAAPASFLWATQAETGWLSSLRYSGDTNRVEFLRAGELLVVGQ
jgi:hypothetical protein